MNPNALSDDELKRETFEQMKRSGRYVPAEVQFERADGSVLTLEGWVATGTFDDTDVSGVEIVTTDDDGNPEEHIQKPMSKLLRITATFDGLVRAARARGE